MYKARKLNILFTNGFALPTVLVASVVLLMVLVAAVSTTVAVDNGLRERNYLRQAGLAAEAGKALATACLGLSEGTVTWTDVNPLRPNTDCHGTIDPNKSPYVLNSSEDGFRTYFVVDTSLNPKGYVEALRKSNGLAWRVWSNTASAAQTPGGAAVPVGTYIEGAWTTAPAGYLLADGSAVSRTTYANLFAVIGTTYGAGNGSTTFNVPDTRGRVAVAQSPDAEFDTLGEKYGEKTHTLTVAEMPSHTHKYDWGSPSSAGGVTSFNGWRMPRDNSGYSTSAPFSAAGGDQAHNNIQPSIVVNRAIKY